MTGVLSKPRILFPSGRPSSDIRDEFGRMTNGKVQCRRTECGRWWLILPTLAKWPHEIIGWELASRTEAFQRYRFRAKCSSQPPFTYDTVNTPMGGRCKGGGDDEASNSDFYSAQLYVIFMLLCMQQYRNACTSNNIFLYFEYNKDCCSLASPLFP